MNEMMRINDPSALAAFDDFAATSGTASVQYLKFTKAGEFLYGQEENVVEDDEQFAADMQSLSQGFICWKEGQCAGETMAPVVSGRTIKKADLEDYGPYEGNDGWKEQSTIEFTSLETGEKLLFKTSSRGGLGALSALAKEFSARVRSGTRKIVPVIVMKTSHYKHAKYGKIYTPKFEVIDWLLPPGAEDDGAVEGEVIPADPPKRRKARAVPA